MRFGALLLFAAIAAFGQVRLNYYEGDITFDGQAPAATVTTRGGRAELLLTPDVYLRVGEQGSVRIGSDIELLRGSAVIDSSRTTASVSPVTMKVRGTTVQLTEPGDYRFDFEPPQLVIYRGAAQISQNGQITSASKSLQAFPLGQPGQGTPNPDTLLDIWSTNRRIRLSSVMAGTRPVEQPLTDGRDDVAGGPSALIGLFPLTGIPELMYTPMRPYRPGTPFYGPGSGFLYPYLPYPAPYRPLTPRPAIGLHPGIHVPGGLGGPHIPGPVIGH